MYCEKLYDFVPIVNEFKFVVERIWRALADDTRFCLIIRSKKI